MKDKILISAHYLINNLDKPYIPETNTTYRDYLEKSLNLELIIPDVVERLSENKLIQIFNENTGIKFCIVGDDFFTENVYKIATDLKVVIKWGTGIDSLNKDIAKKYNIIIRNTPSAFSIPVAESTIGMMLSFLRKLHTSTIEMKKGNWLKIQGSTLHESTVGIIGMGNIGTEVANLLNNFGSKILYYDINNNKNNFRYQRVHSLEELLNRSNIITIHCDLNYSSKHLISKNELKLLKGKILINTARGPIINNNDLEEFIKDNEIFVGLDVYEKEPLPTEHIFRKNENMILSSHNANNSKQFWNNIHNKCIEYLKEYK